MGNSPNESIKFSVLIPYYNEGYGVIPTIESLQNQTYKNWELICVDDGSTDKTAEILNHLSSKDKRIRVISKKNEGTPAKAINYGIQYITGDYYFYSSKDDLFSADFFESAYKVIQNNDLDAIFPNLYYHYKTHDDVFFSTDDKLSTIVDGKFASEMIAFGFHYPGNAIVKTSIVKKIGCYTFSFNSDEYTAIEYLRNCKNVGFCKSIFYYTQDDPNAFTKSLSKKRLTGLETNNRKLKLFENTDNIELLKYLKEYNIQYFAFHLYWYLQLYKKKIPCKVTKLDFYNCYNQYRDTFMAVPITGPKMFILKCCASNFNMLYTALKILTFFKR